MGLSLSRLGPEILEHFCVCSSPVPQCRSRTANARAVQGRTLIWVCFEELTFEQKILQSWLLVCPSLLAQGGSAPTSVTNLEPITVSRAALEMVSSLVLQSLFSDTHLAHLLILTGVQCRYRTSSLNSGVARVYVVACMRTHAVKMVPDILRLWNLYPNFRT